MSNPSLDLNDITYEDYLLMEYYIDESLSLKSREEKEVDALLEKITEANKKLSINTLSADSVNELTRYMKELEKKADKIQNANVKVYTIIGVITKSISVIDNITNIINDLQSLASLINLSESSIFDTASKMAQHLLSKENIKNMLKEFFSLKNLVKIALLTINKMIYQTSMIRKKEEKFIDKTYEILLNCEAKMMTTKRQAQKNNDKETISVCNDVIDFIERFKKDRERQRFLEKNVVKESSIISEEYKGNEYKINTLRLICRDLGEALDINLSNLRTYCNTAVYITRRILEMNDSNKDKKLDTIKKKIKEADDYIKDPGRQYNEDSLKNLYTKYLNMFSTTYSTYGIKVREKFDKRLQEYYKEMISIMYNYKKELSVIVTNTDDSSINTCLDKLEDKLKNKLNGNSIREVKELLSKVDDDSRKTIDNCRDFIEWARKVLQIKLIKSTVMYFVLNRLFK